MSKQTVVKSCLIAVVMSVFLSNAFTDTSARKEKNGNVVLENEFIKAVISPAGGNIIVFSDKVKDINHAFTGAGKYAGMGKPRIFENTNCQEFYTADYDMRILKAGGDEALLECGYTAKDKSHPWLGFEMIKRYSLKNGENRLHMEWLINSHANTGKLTPFMHNYLQLREKSYAYAQTSVGLFCRHVRAGAASESTTMVRSIAEPWGAIVSPQARDGILCYDQSDLTREFLFWLNESNPTIEPLFQGLDFAVDSSWRTRYLFAPLRGIESCHFASADYAGGFCLQDSKSVLKLLPFTNMGKTTLKIYQDDKLLDELSFNARAGVALTFPVSLSEKLQKLKIETAWKKQNKTHFIWASPLPEGQVKGERELKKNTDAGREYARCHVPKGKMFVTPEMTVPLGCISVQYNLPDKIKNTLRLIIDVPEGIKLMNPIAHWGGTHNQISESKIELDGQIYRRYVIARLSNTRGVNGNSVFASTDWPVGKKGVMFYHLEWDGGDVVRQQIEVESVHIPKAPFPKQLITSIPGLGMYQKLIDHWPGFYEVMRHVGSNTISSTTHALLYSPETLVEYFRKAREEGFYTLANSAPFHRARPGWHYSEDIEKFPAVTLMGEKSIWPCPSYRGKAFQDHASGLAAAGKLGASMLSLDTESWSGGDFCYCERCLARFKEFMTKNHPDKTHLDPRIFRKEPEKYPGYIKIWDDFKAMLGCEMYRPISEQFARNVKESGTPGPYMFGPYGNLPADAIRYMFFRLRDLLDQGIVNMAQPSPYTRGDALKFIEQVKMAREATGNSNILTFMSAGWVYADDEYPARDFRYCLLENFLNGARGYLILPWYGLDADDLREHAIVMHMVVPVEDIIIEGTVIESLQTSAKDVKICGLEKGDERIVLLSEYYGSRDTPVSFEIKVDAGCRVINMLTGENIGKLVKGANTVKTVIPANDRAVLLYIGNRKFNFTNRQDPVFSKADYAKQPKTTSVSHENVPVPENPEGKLTLVEHGKKITVANPFYKLSFFAGRGDRTWVEFADDPPLEFYVLNSLRYEGKYSNFPNAQTKKEIERTPDGKEIQLVFSGSFDSKSYKTDYRVTYTFYHDRPLFKFDLEIVSDPVVRWFGSANYWNFGKDISEKLMPRYHTGPLPVGSGRLLEQLGNSIMAGDWKLKYKYFAVSDDVNAVGMIVPSQTNSAMYMYKKGNGYITGSKIVMDTKEFRTSHYVYLGPVDGLAGWAERLYKK